MSASTVEKPGNKSVLRSATNYLAGQLRQIGIDDAFKIQQAALDRYKKRG